jgi:hypothetical protein
VWLIAGPLHMLCRTMRIADRSASTFTTAQKMLSSLGLSKLITFEEWESAAPTALCMKVLAAW